MRAVRLLLVTLSITLALLSIAVVTAHGQPVDQPPSPVLSTLFVVPPSPCVDDDIVLGALVPDCAPCSYVIGVDSLARRIDVAVHRDCATFAPCPTDTVWFPLGRLAAGFHTAVVTYRVFTYEGGALVDSTDHRAEEAFTVSPSCPDTLPYVGAVVIGQPPPSCDACPPVVCPGRPIPVRVSGAFPNDCFIVRRVELVPSIITVIGPPTLRIVVDDMACLRRICVEEPTPWSAQAALPALPAGNYLLPVQIVRTTCSDSFPPESLHTARFAFTVQDTCPFDETLPYVTDIRIGGTPPICPNTPIPVRVSGVLPDDCVEFRRIELLPSPVMSPLPVPPVVRLTFAVNDCTRQACLPDSTPFQASAALPGLLGGNYSLLVQVMEVSRCDSTHVVALHDTLVGFQVALSCPPPPPDRCFHHEWGEEPFDWAACDAFLGAGDSADVDLRIASPVALAGLQGVLHHDPSLEIADLEPTGPAAGMHLQWVRTLHGARFVLFAESGAPIPPFATAPDDTAYDFARVLRVTMRDGPVIATVYPPRPPVSFLWADSLIGADSLGGLVASCPLPCPAIADERCAYPRARICRTSACDFNGDGIGDVRDLVLMVHCVLDTGPCADTTSSHFDCDGDGGADLADVLCCARTVLRGGRPDTLQARPDPDLSLRFGAPSPDALGLTLPVVFEGVDRVGAARLVLRFPADRYTVEGVTTGADPADWLALHEVAGDELVIGLIALAPERAASQMPFTLRLALRSGQSNGGQVELTQADVSAPDGATLLTTLPGVGAVLDPSAPATLSAAHPNPFSHEATFSVALAREAQVDLGVYDLAGRRVATLHRGTLGAGLRSFAWNGRDDDGGRARDGIYFVRLRTDGAEVARKVVLTRGR